MKRWAFLVLLAPFTPTADAGLITQYQSDGPSQFQGQFAPLSFDKYQGSGTLESVTLTEHASIRNDFALTFYNATTLSVSVHESIFGFDPITLTRSANSTGAEHVSLPEVVTPFSRTLTLDPKDFVGSGKFTLPVDSAAFSSFTSGDGNGYGSVTTYGTADATLTYTFLDAPPPPGNGGGSGNGGQPGPQTAVPEPATMTLLSAGLLIGLAARTVRSRRKA